MITQEQLKIMFDYSGGFLYRKTTGSIAGGKRWMDEYWEIMIDRKKYMAHRLIFLWHNGYLPKTIDHIVRLKDGGTNKIENLRACTQSQNIANRPKQFNNKSGFKGVSWREDTKCWQAKICYNKKQIHIGHFDTKEDAARAYDQKAIELFKEFAHLNFP